ncbi:PAS domain-containing protein [Aestuariispira insulae]|uniref:PAS domain S-box-containing protein n=1 Tax=Aestuariispira insulae TaxID=1461337 RepID=A0A3D9HWB6_9PROT|nr:PAS domain-containing protein [Aestuariispira insulae]RED53792.1 PAS domain S-box-containing protein [Aestuariispira insulae]
MSNLTQKKILTGVERTFDASEIIVTKTDLAGKMTYCNRTFLKLAGYEEKECLGVQHNLIRHPDMPRSVFKLLWDTLQAGQEIFAYVNNRSKNGDHYWVLAHVTPSFSANGEVLGYHSNRRVPNRAVIDEHIIPLYAQLLEIEKSHESPKEGMNNAVQTVMDLLQENRVGFNEFMFSLGV